MKSHFAERSVELLAPAANLSVGVAAIDAGADAVYIGGPAFGARAAAGNSMADIGELCRYAHLFGVRVFLTLNTMLKKEEVESAVNLIWEAYNVGLDAVIIQDFELLNHVLPPIPLHASTQCFNFDADKVLALQDAGFERVVLERALSITEIRAIRSATEVELEAFIHGAICVGYSGRCNLSEHLTGRSGNRGECAQPCRSTYDLVDANGKVIIKDEMLLSPRDMNLSARIGEMVAAGVSSLKIEGRLKDEAYVVGVVAHYNNIVNGLGVRRPSYGRTITNFSPDVALNFNRGFTEWFFDGPAAGVGVERTLPGKITGVVKSVASNFFTLNTAHNLVNGDGIAFLDANGRVAGVRVNKVEGDKIFPLKMDGIFVGRQISQTSRVGYKPSSVRVIDIDVEFSDGVIYAHDDYGFSATVELPTNIESATNIEKATVAIRSSFAKMGGTIFNLRNLEITALAIPFIPLSQLNNLRRQLLERLSVSRAVRNDRVTKQPNFVADNDDYLLRSRYCILRERGMCLKTKPNVALPMHLLNNGRQIRLAFNCDKCEMSLLK